MHAPPTRDERADAEASLDVAVPRLATLEALARQNGMTAICLDNTITPCAMPDGLRRLGVDVHPSAATAVPIAFIHEDDRPLVLSAVLRARAIGASAVTVRRAGIEEPELLHVIDMTPEWDTLVVLVGGVLRPLERHASADVPARRPRRLVHHRDRTGHTIWVDDATEQLLEWTPAQVIGRSALDLVEPADHERAIQGWVDMLAGLPQDRLRVRYLTAGGGHRWMEVSQSNRLDEPGAGYVEVELIDVDDEMLALTAVRSGAAQFDTLSDSLPVGVVQVDARGEIVHANRWLRDLAATPGGADPAIDSIAEADRLPLCDSFERAIVRGEAVDIDVVLKRATDGESRTCRVRVRSLGVDELGRRRGAIASIEDVTDALRQHERLREQARTDFLTGLPNRLAVNEWMDAQLCGHDSPGATVFYFDLDRFKVVNDQLGHDTGDQLLRQIADAIRRVVAPGDLVARVGGDEFVVARTGWATLGGIADVADSVLSVFDQTFPVAGTDISVGCSIGVTRGRDAADAPMMLTRADIAMYRAKREGGGRWRLNDEPWASDEQRGGEFRPVARVAR